MVCQKYLQRQINEGNFQARIIEHKLVCNTNWYDERKVILTFPKFNDNCQHNKLVSAGDPQSSKSRKLANKLAFVYLSMQQQKIVAIATQIMWFENIVNKSYTYLVKILQMVRTF